MDEPAQTQPVKDKLGSFIKLFNKYANEIFGQRRRGRLDNLRTELQKLEPEVTRIMIEILGDGVISTGGFGVLQKISHRDLLPTALMGGNNEMKHNFHDYQGPVTAWLNRALGAIAAGLWPPKEPKPVLVIKDSELRSRCLDLLRAPAAYDRVI